MTVMILAFGIAREIFGRSSFDMELSSGATVGHLKNLLEDEYPRLKQLSSFMIAVNNEYASPDEVLDQRDEIAIIPPVSGG